MQRILNGILQCFLLSFALTIYWSRCYLSRQNNTHVHSRVADSYRQSNQQQEVVRNMPSYLTVSTLESSSFTLGQFTHHIFIASDFFPPRPKHRFPISLGVLLPGVGRQLGNRRLERGYNDMRCVKCQRVNEEANVENFEWDAIRWT